MRGETGAASFRGRDAPEEVLVGGRLFRARAGTACASTKAPQRALARALQALKAPIRRVWDVAVYLML